jgi:hypothetical protein
MEDDMYNEEQDDPTSEENRADDHWTEYGDDLPPLDDWFAVATDITGVAR